MANKKEKYFIEKLELRVKNIESSLRKILDNHLHHIQLYQWYLMGLIGVVLVMMAVIMFKINAL
tara:strand:+ start:152 stop:343 length:192 start_codon:yes stop_codon:yes gene_type:complete